MMHHHKTFFGALGAISLLAALTIGSTTQAAPKIGTVDMQKALQTVAEGRKAKKNLEGVFNKKKKELQSEEAAIKKMHEEFQKQSLVMSEQARAKKQGEIQQRVIQFQQKTQASQIELQKQEQEMTGPIIQKLRGVIEMVAKENGYTIILEKNENSVLFSEEKDDLTSKVIQAYDSRSGKKKG